MLNVKDISVTYGKGGTHRAIDQMSWQLETGTVLAVAGPSGCGKSTMVHALAGILPYTAPSPWMEPGLTPNPALSG